MQALTNSIPTKKKMLTFKTDFKIKDDRDKMNQNAPSFLCG